MGTAAPNIFLGVFFSIHFFVVHTSLFFSKLNEADKKTVDKLNYKPGDEVTCFASKVDFYSLRKSNLKLHELLK